MIQPKYTIAVKFIEVMKQWRAVITCHCTEQGECFAVLDNDLEQLMTFAGIVMKRHEVKI